MANPEFIVYDHNYQTTIMIWCIHERKTDFVLHRDDQNDTAFLDFDMTPAANSVVLLVIK